MEFAAAMCKGVTPNCRRWHVTACIKKTFAFPCPFGWLGNRQDTRGGCALAARIAMCPCRTGALQQLKRRYAARARDIQGCW